MNIFIYEIVLSIINAEIQDRNRSKKINKKENKYDSLLKKDLKKQTSFRNEAT